MYAPRRIFATPPHHHRLTRPGGVCADPLVPAPAPLGRGRTLARPTRLVVGTGTRELKSGVVVLSYYAKTP
jgi:hypothetical protein